MGALASLLLIAVPAPAGAQDGVATTTAEPREVAACLDANERSITLENAGSDIAAREELRTCAAPKCPTEIREECERRLNQLAQVIPSVLFEFSDTQGNPVNSVKIRVDGGLQTTQPIVEADPGQHVFVFEAPGYTSVQRELFLSPRQQRRVERITLSASTAAGAASATEEAPRAKRQELHGQRLTALILGGVSVVAAGVGTTFGLMAIHRDSEVDKVCDAHQCANSADAQKSRTAAAQGNVSTALFAVAAAAAGGGVLLWLTAPEDHPEEKKVQLGLGLGSLRLRGTF